MRGGEIDPDIRAELLASHDPAHARARALLTQIDRERAGQDGDANAIGPEIELPDGGAGPWLSGAGRVPVPRPTTRADPGPAPAPETPTTPATPTPHRPVLERISLRAAKDGMTLTLHATAGVVVGSAHQPASGTLRLVVEAAGATPGLLRARPSRGQVRVTDVKRGGNTVIVEVRLPPGWRVGRTTRYAGGARVRLVAP
jgi:hypothetical protein